MAIFCQRFKMSPSDYKNLTLAEYVAFIEAASEIGSTTNLEDLL
jgi:hypothetical protein